MEGPGQQAFLRIVFTISWHVFLPMGSLVSYHPYSTEEGPEAQGISVVWGRSQSIMVTELKLEAATVSSTIQLVCHRSPPSPAQTRESGHLLPSPSACHGPRPLHIHPLFSQLLCSQGIKMNSSLPWKRCGN